MAKVTGSENGKGIVESTKVETTKVELAKGVRRITSKVAGNSLASNFVSNLILPVNAMADFAKAKTLLVFDKSMKCTPFGHNQNNAMTSIIDGALLDMMNGQVIDTKLLVDKIAHAITTTGNFDYANEQKFIELHTGKKIAMTFLQVHHTLIKTSGHLHNFDADHAKFNKWLTKKQYNKTHYQNSGCASWCRLMKPTCYALATDIELATKVAKIKFAPEWSIYRKAKYNSKLVK